MEPEPIVIAIDLDDVLFKLRKVWLEKLSAAAQIPLEETDWREMGRFPVSKLCGKPVIAGIPLSRGRVSQGNEFFAGTDQEVGHHPDGRIGLTVRDFLSPELYHHARPVEGAQEAVHKWLNCPGCGWSV